MDQNLMSIMIKRPLRVSEMFGFSIVHNYYG